MNNELLKKETGPGGNFVQHLMIFDKMKPTMCCHRPSSERRINRLFSPIHLFFSFFQVYKFKINRKAHNMQNNNKPFSFFFGRRFGQNKRRGNSLSPFWTRQQ